MYHPPKSYRPLLAMARSANKRIAGHLRVATAKLQREVTLSSLLKERIHDMKRDHREALVQVQLRYDALDECVRDKADDLSATTKKLANSQFKIQELQRIAEKHEFDNRRFCEALEARQSRITELEAIVIDLQAELAKASASSAALVGEAQRAARDETRERLKAAHETSQRKLKQALRRERKKIAIRRVKADDSARSLQKYKALWAEELEFHMRVRREMSREQMTAAVGQLAKDLGVDDEHSQGASLPASLDEGQNGCVVCVVFLI